MEVFLCCFEVLSVGVRPRAQDLHHATSLKRKERLTIRGSLYLLYERKLAVTVRVKLFDQHVTVGLRHNDPVIAEEL